MLCIRQPLNVSARSIQMQSSFLRSLIRYPGHPYRSGPHPAEEQPPGIGADAPAPKKMNLQSPSSRQSPLQTLQPRQSPYSPLLHNPLLRARSLQQACVEPRQCLTAFFARLWPVQRVHSALPAFLQLNFLAY